MYVSFKTGLVTLLLLAGSTVFSQGTVETSYRDGSRTVRLTLVQDKVLVEGKRGRSIREVDPGARPRSVEAATVGSTELSVFRTDAGELLSAIGGIILVLDASWTQEDVDEFLDTHDLTDNAEVTDILPNSCVVKTDPGTQAIDLANRLAALEGVVVSVPNWWREVKQR